MKQRYSSPMRGQESKHAASAASLCMHISTPLSEYAILEFSDLFLRNGLHHLSVGNMQEGRALILSFLSTLPYYHAVGCLTLSSAPEKPFISDVLQDLMQGGIIHHEEAFTEYFIEQCDYDFLWIESSTQLMQTAWYHTFLQKLHECTMYERIPVMILSDAHCVS
jgi:hypothetical protein